MATKKTEAAPKTTGRKTSSAAKTTAGKTSTTVKTSGSKTSSSAKTSGNKTSSTSTKTPAQSSSEKLTAAEKKLLAAYRAADQDKRDAALAVLEKKDGDEGNVISTVLAALTGASGQQAQTDGANPLLGALLSAAGNGGDNGGLLGTLLSGAGSNSAAGQNGNAPGALAALLSGLLK